MRTMASRSRAFPLGAVLDGAVVMFLAALAAWSFVAAGPAGSDPVPVALLVGACLLAAAAARAVGAIASWPVPLAVTVGAAAVWASAPLDTTGRGPLRGPFGYANAKAAFFALAAVGALQLWASARPFALRAAAIAAALAFASVPLLTGASAASALILVVVPPVLLIRSPRAVRAWVAAAAGLFAVVLSATVWLGARYQPGSSGPVDRLVDRTLSENRPALWHDAIVLLLDQPIDGVGPGRFDETSPIARGDADRRWAHNGFLQVGAETGVPGSVFLVAGVLAALARLGTTARPDARVASGASALALLSVAACIDYVLHFAAVPITAAALAGGAPAGGTGRGP